MSDSDEDWFNKDENEMVQSLQQQVNKVKNYENEERIEFTGKTGKLKKAINNCTSMSNT